MIYSHYYPSSRLFHGAVSHLMGTRLDVLLFGEEPAMLDALWRRITNETKRLERILNRFDTESTLSRLNREAAFCPVHVPEELWPVLLECRHYFERTDNCFDITRGCFDQMEWDETHRTIYLKGDANIDLGGCGKGYALRLIHRLLGEEAVSQALVNFGNSSILAVGAHPHTDHWPVGIEDPYTGSPLDDIHLCDSSLSVSGNSPARPEHIVQPATGAYVTGRKMVAAVAADPVDAEVLTTALMATSREKAEKIINRFEVKEYKIYE